MMENPYQRLSPSGNVRPCPGQSLRGHFTIPTLSYNNPVSGTPVQGQSHHLPLNDNCENSFGNAGKARAVLSMPYNQMGCRMA